MAVPNTCPSPLAKRLALATSPISALAASAILAVLIQVYAGATLRGVYADGSYFATRLAQRASQLGGAAAILCQFGH
jgi:hypothetical protein